jgi:hypothetical protein
VDLKAAVRYLGHNAGVIPGNVNWIVSTGVSARGAKASPIDAGSDPEAALESAAKTIGAGEADRLANAFYPGAGGR